MYRRTDCNRASRRRQAWKAETNLLLARVGVQRVRRSEPDPGRDCRDAGNELVDWTGRQTRPDKRGQIAAELSPILRRLRLSPEPWVETVLNFGRWFRLAAGRVDTLAAEAARRGHRWLQGVSHSRAAFA